MKAERPVTQRIATRRLFFALWPDESFCRTLLQAAGSLWQPLSPDAVIKRRAASALSAPELHVTLVFLGATPESALPALKSAAAAVAAASFGLHFARFEYWRGSQLLCAIADPVPAAARHLQRSLQAAALSAASGDSGSDPPADGTTGHRPFRPHISLMRGLRPADAPQAYPQLALDFSATKFSLAESLTVGEGGRAQSRYRVLGSWPLSRTRAP